MKHICPNTSVKEKFLTLALCFPLIFFIHICFYLSLCVLICFSKFMFSLCSSLSMLGCQFLCFSVFVLWFMGQCSEGVYVCVSSQYAYAYKWVAYTCPMNAHAYFCPKTLIRSLFVFSFVLSTCQPLFFLFYLPLNLYFSILFGFICFISSMFIKVLICMDTMNMHMNMNMH